MVATVKSLGLHGFGAIPVEVEADLSAGLPRFDLVGLPGSSVSESRERVRSAIHNCGLVFPVRRITVNLAPADVRKEGPVYDLPILAAILKASGQLGADLADSVLLGELSLSGELRRINGVLPMLLTARESGVRRAFVPDGNAAEASVVAGMDIYAIHDVPQLLRHLSGEAVLQPIPTVSYEPGSTVVCGSAGDPGSGGSNGDSPDSDERDFADVRGQLLAKRALEIAAAGGHNVLMVGPPGSGKSMLAGRLPSILPEMTYEEALETTKIYSVAGLLPEQTVLLSRRPFRAPHHLVTAAAMTGGGTHVRPGEISLSNNGVLFLDELPLFRRSVLESLRQPVENGQITISRSNFSATYPSNIMLICAMNPCPCGYYGDPERACSCTDASRKAYLSRISGPLLDRIDIYIKVNPLPKSDLFSAARAESSAVIRQRVAAARAVQVRRFRGTGISCNARMSPEQVEDFCRLDASAQSTLERAYESLRFSARASGRIRRTARTIADLDGAAEVAPRHIMEAIQYRAANGLE